MGGSIPFKTAMTRKSILWSLSLVGMLTLTACTEWVKSGVSPLERDRDFAACKAIGYDRFPENHQGTVYTSGEKKCKWKDGKEKCEYESSSFQLDANQAGRGAAIEDCMYRRGYSKE